VTSDSPGERANGDGEGEHSGTETEGTTDESGDVPAVDELLALLGNETRMAIMRALWAEFEFADYVTERRTGHSFSELLEATGVTDSGNFNYHLGELSGVLVADREDGYVLTPLGYNLMQSIDRYDSFAYTTLEERVADDACPYCGGDLVVAYRREIVSVRCRDCGGLASDGDFTFVEVPAFGAQQPETAELLDAATLAMFAKVRSSRYGVCWDCRAPMERSLDLCGAHEPESSGVCGDCGRRYAAVVDANCGTCGESGRGPALEYAIVTPSVAAFFESLGVGPGQVGPWRYRLAALATATETVERVDAPTVAVTFERDGRRQRAVVENSPTGIEVTVE
jgi:DNA-binding transcriptional ArsR family regulator